MQSSNLPQDRALDFIIAGNAIFTVVSLKTGNRFTYKSFACKDINGNLTGGYDIGVVTGTDNTIFAPLCHAKIIDFVPSVMRNTSRNKRSWIKDNAPSLIAFKYIFTRLVLQIKMTQVEFWHEGRCGRCGRSLTVPESIDSGFGPECIKVELSKISEL